ncbi:hypothetical protein TPENAI_60777 [Tenacibaculum litopenaei]|uniref:hypothetical protein n=1 Tax=Tenacibaculum litopenaei TaxID=396016 RepID=UPI0038945D38
MKKTIELNDMKFDAKPINTVLNTRDPRGLSDDLILKKDEFLYGTVHVVTPTDGLLGVSLRESFPFGRPPENKPYYPTLNFVLSGKDKIENLFFRSFLLANIKNPHNTLLFSGLKLKLISEFNEDYEYLFTPPVTNPTPDVPQH